MSNPKKTASLGRIKVLTDENKQYHKLLTDKKISQATFDQVVAINQVEIDSIRKSALFEVEPIPTSDGNQILYDPDTKGIALQLPDGTIVEYTPVLPDVDPGETPPEGAAIDPAAMAEKEKLAAEEAEKLKAMEAAKAEELAKADAEKLAVETKLKAAETKLKATEAKLAAQSKIIADFADKKEGFKKDPDKTDPQAKVENTAAFNFHNRLFQNN